MKQQMHMVRVEGLSTLYNHLNLVQTLFGPSSENNQTP